MITRKELINSAEYWQTQHEILCYRENIKPTLQLVDKKEMSVKACEKLADVMRSKGYSIIEINILVVELRKAMEE